MKHSAIYIVVGEKNPNLIYLDYNHYFMIKVLDLFRWFNPSGESVKVYNNIIFMMDNKYYSILNGFNTSILLCFYCLRRPWNVLTTIQRTCFTKQISCISQDHFQVYVYIKDFGFFLFFFLCFISSI